MMPCISASRGYRPSPSPSPSPISTTTCSLLSDASGGSEISSSAFVSRKKPRTRRKRPQQMYNEAAAALSAIYPKIFSQRHRVPHHKFFDLKAWKRIEPLRFKEEGVAELLLQEVPTLIGRVRELDESELLCNEGTPPELKLKCGAGASLKQLSRLIANDSYDAESKPQSLLQGKVEVEMESASPSLDDDDSWGNEYDYFLESNNGVIDGGIMSSIMGSDANPNTEEGLGVFGFAQGTQYNLHSSAAIRALRRSSDCRLSDKIMAGKERNTMFFSSLEWLKRDDAQQRLKLKLNYEDVLNAWSDRGPLYTDEVQHPPIVPDDSYSELMATSMNFDVVPDLGFWMTTGNGLYGQVADRSSAVLEDGMINGSGVREASVLRYKEKRRTRLFSKKIRYEVRKFNAERRPRMKGRFVRRLANL